MGKSVCPYVGQIQFKQGKLAGHLFWKWRKRKVYVQLNPVQAFMHSARVCSLDWLSAPSKWVISIGVDTVQDNNSRPNRCRPWPMRMRLLGTADDATARARARRRGDATATGSRSRRTEPGDPREISGHMPNSGSGPCGRSRENAPLIGSDLIKNSNPALNKQRRRWCDRQWRWSRLVLLAARLNQL
jgi:hypothetical protein